MRNWESADATPDDAAPLACILGDWVRETGWMPILHGREEDIGFLSGLIRSAKVRVAREDGAALGFLARDGSIVRALYLRPTARGQGVGKGLLEEAKAAEGALSLWVFQANSAAVAFYHREGFAEVERTDGSGNEEQLPDILMRWTRAQ